METLLLDDALYVQERYEELEMEKRRHSGHHHSGMHGFRRDPQSTRHGGDSLHDEAEDQEDGLARLRALDAAWPTTLQEKRLKVMEASLQELTLLTRLGFEEAEKVDEDGDDSTSATLVKSPKSHDPALPVDETTPKSLQDLPMASQLSLKMFFRLCGSLRSAGNANERLLGMIASKIPAMLGTLPSLSLSPGVVDSLQASASGETLSHAPTLSVFQELLGIYGDFLGIREEPNDSTKDVAKQNGDISLPDKANAVMAYVALSLKWGRLRDLVQAMLLLIKTPDILSSQHISLLRKLLSELGTAQAEIPSQPLLPHDSSPVGLLVSFGKGDHGKLGHGQCTHASCSEGNCTENKNVPTVIASTRDVQFAKIDSLSTHSVAITTKGDVMAWGNGDKYRLGHGTTSKEYAPRIIDSLSLKGKVADVACGLGHTIALMAGGDIYAWGNGSNGRLGLGDTNDRSSPTKVSIPDESASRSSTSAFRYVVCGASHSLALTSDGRAFAWGKNNQGQCGHGHTNDQLVAAEIKHFREELVERVTHASGGWEHTLFCSASGRVYSCGCGYKDSRRTGIPPVLGHGDCEKRLKPTVIQSLADANEEIVRVSCGWDHSLAVSAEGGLFTWGSGTNGKLGHGDEENCDVPTLVRSLNGKIVKDAKAGCEHTVALTNDHEVWTFGQGDSGRLGLGDTITRKSPTLVEFFGQSGLRPVAIAVGDKYNLVLAEDAGSPNRQAPGASPAKSGSPSKYRQGYHSRQGDVTSANRTRRHLSVVEAFKRKTIGGSSTEDGSSFGLFVKASASEDSKYPDDQSEVIRWIASHVARISSEYLQKLGEGDVFHAWTSRRPTTLLPFGVDASVVTVRRLLELISTLQDQGLQTSSASDQRERAVVAARCLRLLTVNIRFWTQSPSSPNRSGQEEALFDRVHTIATGFATKGMSHFFTNGYTGNDQVQALDSAIREEAALILKVGFSLFFPTRDARVELLWDLVSSDEVGATQSPLRAQALAAKLREDAIMGEVVRGYFSRSMAHECDSTSDDQDGGSKRSLLQRMTAALEASFSDATKQLEGAKEPQQHGETVRLQLLGVLQGHIFAAATCSTLPADTATGTKTGINDGTSWEPGPACECCAAWLLTYLSVLADRSVELLKALGNTALQSNSASQDQAGYSVLTRLLLPALQATCAIVGPTNNAPALTYENALRFVEAILPRANILMAILDEMVRHTKARGDASVVTPRWIVDLGDACAVLCGRLARKLMQPAVSLGTESELRVLMGRPHEIIPVGLHHDSSAVTSIVEWEERISIDSGAADPTNTSRWEDGQRFLVQCLEDQALLERVVLAIEKYRQAPDTAIHIRFKTNSRLQQLRNYGFVLIVWFADAATEVRECTCAESDANRALPSSRWIARALAMYETALTTEKGANMDESITRERARQLLGFKSSRFHALSSSSLLQQWVGALQDYLIGGSCLHDLEGSLLEHINRPLLLQTGLKTFSDALRRVASPSMKGALLQELFHATIATNPRRSPPSITSASFTPAVEDLGQSLVNAVTIEGITTMGKTKALGVWLWILRSELVDSSKLSDIIARSGLIGQLGDRLIAKDRTLSKHEYQPNQAFDRLEVFATKEKRPSQPLAQRLQPVEALMATDHAERTFALAVYEVFAAAAEHLYSISRMQTTPSSTAVGSEQPLDFLVRSLQRDVINYEKTLEILSPLTRGEERGKEPAEPAAAFLLASPLSISASRSHIGKTLRIPRSPPTAPSRPSRAMSFWMYVDESTVAGSQNTRSPVNFVSLGCMSDRLQESASLTGSNQAVEIEASDRMRLVVFGLADENKGGCCRIAYAVDIAAEGSPASQWLTMLSEESFHRHRWLHVTVSVDGARIALYVNGDLTACQLLPTDSSRSGESIPSGCSLGQLNARMQVVCGGSLSETFHGQLGITSLLQNEQQTDSSSPQDSATSLTALIDDLWLYTTPLEALSARALYDQGPTFLQVRREFDVEQNLLRSLRVMYKVLPEMSVWALPSAATTGSRPIASLIGNLVRLLRQGRRESAHEVALLAAEVLKQLLSCPQSPQPARDLLDSVIACLQPAHPSSYDLRTHLLKLYAFGARAGVQSGAIVASQAAMSAIFIQQGVLKSDSSGLHQTLQPRGRTVVDASIVHLLQLLHSSSAWRPLFLERMDKSESDLQVVSASCDGPTVPTVLSIMISAGHSELFLNDLKLSLLAKRPTLKAVRWMDLVPAWTSIASMSQESHSTAWPKFVRQFGFKLLDESLRLPHFNGDAKSQGEVTRASDIQQLQVLELQVKALRSKAFEAATRRRGWCAALLSDSTTALALLDICATTAKDHIRHKLGLDAKRAYQLHSVRSLLTALVGRNARSNGRHRVNVQDEIEALAWELASRREQQQRHHDEGIMAIDQPIPWRLGQHRGSPLEALGGEVVIRGLTVQAVQHFPTVRLGRVAITANSGLWYYEVQVLTDGLMQVGYVDSEFVADAVQGQGVGDQTNSWAFDGYRCKKWNVSSVEYGEPWQAGDVVGVLLDTDRMELSYFLNHKFLGIAFSNLPLTSTTVMHPAVSLNADQRVRFNFGRREDGSTIDSHRCTHELLPLPPLQSPLDQKRLQAVVYAMEDVSEELDSHSISEEELDSSDGDGDEDLAFGNDQGSEDDNHANDQSVAIDDKLPGRLSEETISVYHRSGRYQPHPLPGALQPMDRESYAVTSVVDSSSILPNPRVGSDYSHRDGSEDSDQDDGRNGDDESASRQAELTDGLVNLGFPRSWAVRCAHETSFTSNDSGAVSWILEQMEKEATSSVLRSFSDVARYADNGLEPTDVESSTVPAPRRAQDDSSLVSVSGGASRMLHLALSPTRDGRPHTEQQIRSRDRNLSPERPRPTNASCRREQPLHGNPFLSAEMEDDGDDDCEDQEGDSLKLSSASSYRSYTTAVERPLRRDFFGGSNDDSSKTKDDLTQRAATRATIDDEDLIPACVVAQSLLGLCYSRLIAQSLLFDESIDASVVYPVVIEWIAKGRAGLCQFLRIQLQLHVGELPAVLNRADASSQATSLRRGMVKLLRYEASQDSELPLLQAVLQEISSQTTRAARFATRVRLSRSGHQAASPSKIMALAMNARWALWLLSTVQHSITVESPASSRAALDAVLAFLAPTFVENLTTLAASSAGVFLPWQTAAFQLIKISMSIHTLSLGADGTTVSPGSLLPVEFLVERLAQTLYKDLTRSAPVSDTTKTLWEIALAHVPPPAPTQPMAYQRAATMQLHVEQLASTYATISWTCPQPATVTTEDNASGPDSLEGGDASLLDVSASNATTVDVCEMHIRTPCEQVFELSIDACGKNLVLLNRNRTVKNLVNKKWHTVRASVAFDEGVHHWHVRIDACVSKNIFIGVCTADAGLENYIGSDAYGYGFLANKAVWHNKSKLQSYGEIFKQGDLIQVALDCNARTLSYSRNGEFLGVAATNLHVGGSSSDSGGSASGQAGHKWYPAVSLYNKDDQLTIIAPPSASSSTTITGRQRPQCASVLELVDSARLAIRASHLTCTNAAPVVDTTAFNVWKKWKRGELCWREAALCDIVQIDANRDAAMSVFGLGPGDSIFTTRGHCVVLGVAKHELWFEVVDGLDTNASGKALSIGSWSLRTCREMVASPEDYPVHRARRRPIESNPALEGAREEVEGQVVPHNELSTSEHPATVSTTIEETFADAQRELAREELDAGLMALVDALVCHRGLSSPHQLTFADFSSAFVLHDVVDVFQAAIIAPPQNTPMRQEELLMRLATLLDLNQHVYRVVRLFLKSESGTSMQWERSLSLLHDPDRAPSEDEFRSRVAAAARLAASVGGSIDDMSLLGIKGEALVNRRAFMQFLRTRLFVTQREKLISEAMRRTATPTLIPSSSDSKSSDLGNVDASQGDPKDMPRVQIPANTGRAQEPPFWKQELPSSRVWLIPRSKERRAGARFAQLSKQLASVAPHELRREFVSSADVAGISRTFHIVQAEPSDSSQESSSHETPMDQTTAYLKLLDDVFTEIQSPAFPLFVPVASPLPASDNEASDLACRRIDLDVNAHLALPEVAARCEIHVDEALLWFFHVGQLLGVVWRSRSLAPLQFISVTFWASLLQHDNDQDSSGVATSDQDRLRAGRVTVMQAVRDGLCSIVPFECLQLSSPETVRCRLADTDVVAIDRLHNHAIFDPNASHHRLFWSVVRSFSSLERRVLIQFLRGKPTPPVGSVDESSDDPIESWKRRMQSVEVPPMREELTLELAEPLPDALAHPDACFPVVDVVQPHFSRLHLPEYSTGAVLRQKLLLAMHSPLPSY